MKVTLERAIAPVEPALVADHGFDYDALPPEEAEFLRSRTDHIRDHDRSMCESVIHIGRALQEVKHRLDHGQFGAWLHSEFGWTDRTARLCMAAAEQYGDKTEIISAFDVTALHELAAPNTPEEIREAFEDQARAGEPVRGRDVKAAKRQAKDARSDERSRHREDPNLGQLRRMTSDAVAYLDVRNWDDSEAVVNLADAIILTEKNREPFTLNRIADMLEIVAKAYHRAGELLTDQPCVVEEGAA